jgi:hypothetical protein
VKVTEVAADKQKKKAKDKKSKKDKVKKKARKDPPMIKKKTKMGKVVPKGVVA